MPWTIQNPPAVAKNWTTLQKRRCVQAANATLRDTGSDEKAIFACIAAAGKGRRRQVADTDDKHTFEELRSREILKTGTHNGIEFKEDDLHDIVSAFNELRGVHEVPLKFGHNDEQGVTDGQPAIGWVENLFVRGGTLMADFADVPKVVFDAIMKRLYRTVSVELIRSVKHEGRTLSWVLDAVALLGADQPAVRGLQDLAALTLARASFAGGNRVMFSVNAGDLSDKEDEEVSGEGITRSDLKEAIASAVDPLKDQLTDVTSKLKTVEDENVTLKAANKELKDEEDLRKKREKEKNVKASRDMVTKLLEGAVKDNRIEPAQREVYERTLGVDDDERVVKLSQEDVEKLVGKSEQGKDKPGSTGAQGGNSGDGEAPDVELSRLANEEILKSGGKLDFAGAARVVMAAKPDLGKAYITMYDNEGGES